MNLLVHDITEWCKEMNIKNFREFAWLWERVVSKSTSKRRRIDSKQSIQSMNDWLEMKIKQLIRFKKIAERLLANK